MGPAHQQFQLPQIKDAIQKIIIRFLHFLSHSSLPKAGIDDTLCDKVD
jgi:hypothetical protein